MNWITRLNKLFAPRELSRARVVAAVTASDQPVRLPDPKDIPPPDYLQSDLDTLDKGQWFPHIAARPLKEHRRRGRE